MNETTQSFSSADLDLGPPRLPFGEDIIVIVAVLGVAGGLLALFMPDPEHMTLAFVALSVFVLWPALAVGRLRSMAGRRAGRPTGASRMTSIRVFANVAGGTLVWAVAGLMVAGGTLLAFMPLRDFGIAGWALVSAAMNIAALRYASRYVMALPLAAHGGLSVRECISRSLQVSRPAWRGIAAALFGLAQIAIWGVAAALHFGPESRAIAIAAITLSGAVWITAFGRWLLSRLDTLCAMHAATAGLDDLPGPTA